MTYTPRSRKHCGECTCMAYLSYPSTTEVQLRLGLREDNILTVVRRWRWWIRADVEGKLPNTPEVTAVTLTAERIMDGTLRDILYANFQLEFPHDGGEGSVLPIGTRGRRSGRRP